MKNKRFAKLVMTLALAVGVLAMQPTLAAVGTQAANTEQSVSVPVPAEITPVKSYKVEINKSYKLPDDVKQADDAYASSDVATLAVDKATGVFKALKDGVAYIRATNAGVARYIKVTAGTGAVVAQTANTSQASTGASAFVGCNITVYDSATPAAYCTTDRSFTTTTFFSADGAVLGTMPYADYNTIIEANTRMVYLPSGASYSVPPVGEEWTPWVTQEFDKYRGTTSESVYQESKSVRKEIDIVEEANEVIRLVNERRVEVGLDELIVDDSLMSFAMVRAKELQIKKGHVRPNGEVLTNECAAYGERSAAEAFQDWMDSDPHRTAILNENGLFNYNYIGAGCYQAENGKCFWTIHFSV